MAGKVVHFEIPIDEGGRAVAFYRQAFGWHLNREGPLDYWTTAEGEGDGIDGALSKRDPESPGLTIYIAVEDIDESLAAIETAGGRRVTDRLPIPTVGWTAFFIDTEGNRLGLFQEDPSAGDGVGFPP